MAQNFFSGFFDEQKVRKSKEHNLFVIEIFCIVINVFSVTFKQLNESLLLLK